MTTSSTNNPWFAVSMGLIGLIVGYTISTSIHGLGGSTQPAAVGQQPAPAVEENFEPAEPADGIVLGDEDAPVTVIEFTDFQCPFCRKWYRETYKDLKEQYIDTGKVKLVLRHYPLSFHAAAEPSAIAVACAQKQSNDLGWKFHDVILDEQDKTGNVNTVNYGATELSQWAGSIAGLDKTAWQSCFDKKDTLAQVNKDLADGSAAGIDGTPGFWILGPDDQSKRIAGAYPLAEFATAIDGMLE